MTQNVMYPNVVGDLTTTLSAAYTAGTSTAITVLDASIFPDAPNLVTIRRVDKSALVTCKYTTKSGNTLGGLEVLEGDTTAAKIATYEIGSTVYRPFTKADVDAIQANINDLDARTTTAETTAQENKEWIQNAKANLEIDHVDNTADADKTVAAAGKLASAQNFDGVSSDGTTAVNHFAVCGTARTTAAKTVTIANFTLTAGAVAIISFTKGNSATNPTLNINSTGAKSITANGSVLPSWALRAGGVYAFIYNGSTYEYIGSIIDSNPNLEIHGFIVDESNSDPTACITYIGASAGFTTAEAQAVFQEHVRHCVVKKATRQFYVSETDWSKKEDGTTSSGVSNGTSLDGNFMVEYPSFWWRITPLGTDQRMVEFTWDDPGLDSDWVPCHLYDGRIAEYIYTGVFEGYVDGDGKLRSIYSTSLKPTVSKTNEAFRTAAQATGTAEGLSAEENTYTISQPLPYIMRTLLKYWQYKTLDLQTNVARGICDDGSSAVGLRPIGYGMSLTGGYTQGTAASTQAYADNTAAVVGGECNPYGNEWEHMIDFAYRYREIAFAVDGAKHFNITQLTASNWDSLIPALAGWRTVYGVGTGSGYIRKMLWDKYFPLVSQDASGGSATTYYADYTYRSGDDSETSKTPRCCISGAAWRDGSGAGPAYLTLDVAVGISLGTLGARLQCHSLT